ncbi:flavin reductase family protein [Streptomyces sp. NPDC007901]|uniref:flavin reductase family protein n=1 Tax=Streptomyces sp. NPDC007901 TaxID=3364785 RepID=UPI0036EF305E
MSRLGLPRDVAPAHPARHDPHAPEGPDRVDRLDRLDVSGDPETLEGPDGLRRFMRTWGTGITVVSSRCQGRSVGCTVTAFTSVSLCPALFLVCLVCLASTGRTLAVFRARGVFGAGVFAGDQRELAGHFATAPGDRFAAVGHHLAGGVLLLDAALATAVCRVERVRPVAGHTVVPGRPGRPGRYGAPCAAAPLIRFDGASGPLGT